MPEDLLTLGKLRAELVAKQKKEMKNDLRYSRAIRPNLILASSSEKGELIPTEKMMERTNFARLFATSPENPLRNKHCFYGMLSEQNVRKAPRGISELKRPFQREHHFRLDKRDRERCFPKIVRGRQARVLIGEKREKENETYIVYEVSELGSKRLF